MPKISAATVAEHRAAQRRALLDSARLILAETPEKNLSLADVAARAGLTRSSFYNYFDSREDLLHAIVEDMFPRWTGRVAEAMAAADDDDGRILAYIDANLDLVAEGEHAVVTALASFTPQSFRDPRILAMHDQLVLPLEDALRAAGSPDPDMAAQLISAVVHKGTELIEAGRDVEAVRRAVHSVIAANH
ncbi:MAG: TetR/AcrR family transcriptional regulator [Rhodococcus sp. (in: high G+C Gram-positive bacteria)]|uniref:TetR/AcrR family transcriptional regulator n=1 Tax=Rhodococcus sp. TaxID=1831 RepID=UPI003BAEE4D0